MSLVLRVPIESEVGTSNLIALVPLAAAIVSLLCCALRGTAQTKDEVTLSGGFKVCIYNGSHRKRN